MCAAIPLHHVIVTIKAKNSVSQLQVKLNPELLLLIRVSQENQKSQSITGNLFKVEQLYVVLATRF